MILDVQKLDFGSVVTEHTASRRRTRAIEDGEAFVKFVLKEVEKKLRENKLDQFRVVFDIENPPPQSA